MKISKIIESPKLTKRYRVIMDNDDHYDFGLDGGSTYLDHKNKDKREAYWKRHFANPTEHRLILNKKLGIFDAEFIIKSPEAININSINIINGINKKNGREDIF